MIFSLNSTTSSNHLDLLRLLIEVAALADGRTALKLALLSKTTQAWWVGPNLSPVIFDE